MEETLTPREATPQDIPTLVQHRRRMFEEILHLRGMTYDEKEMDAFELRYTRYLRTHLADGTAAAWVVEDQDKIVASGAVAILPWPPGMGEGTAALFHSLFTEPEYRRRGIARGITRTAIDSCRAKGINWMLLGASEAGRPLYESLGFKPGTTMMHLTLR